MEAIFTGRFFFKYFLSFLHTPLSLLSRSAKRMIYFLPSLAPLAQQKKNHKKTYNSWDSLVGVARMN